MYNVIYLLHQHASAHPDRAAFKWGKDGSISYREFTQKISSKADGLKKLGIKKGDRVLIFVPLSLELYLNMFAVQQIGAIAVFLDSWARRDQLGLCAEIAAPKAMISFERAFLSLQDVPELKKIPIKIVSHSSEGREECPIESVAQEDTALITFTTGSSGTPKGANRTHRFLAAQHDALRQVIPYLEKDTDLPTFPIFALNNLASGVSTVLPEIDLANPSHSDGEILAHQILQHQISCTTLSPSLFIKVANYCGEHGIKLPSLRRVVTGGAPISKDNVAQFKTIAPTAKILVLYGSTEVEPIAHIEADEMLADCEKGEGVNVGPIFHDLAYKFIRITKDPIILGQNGWTDWEVKEGEVGELIVSGPHVCEGYYNNEEAFYRAKIRDEQGKIWHRTGDLGSVDSRGNLWFVGRVHNAILRGGNYLFPVQAELLLKKIPFVQQAAFLGLEDPLLGERACAVVSLKSEAKDPSHLTEQIAQLLEKHQIPVDEIQFVENIPMDPRHHSKVEYESLRKQLR